jgi:hypothetical protein
MSPGHAVAAAPSGSFFSLTNLSCNQFDCPYGEDTELQHFFLNWFTVDQLDDLAGTTQPTARKIAVKKTASVGGGGN